MEICLFLVVNIVYESLLFARDLEGQSCAIAQDCPSLASGSRKISLNSASNFRPVLYLRKWTFNNLKAVKTHQDHLLCYILTYYVWLEQSTIYLIVAISSFWTGVNREAYRHRIWTKMSLLLISNILHYTEIAFKISKKSLQYTLLFGNNSLEKYRIKTPWVKI